MNKTVNINLGGMFFHIDEDAYQKLSKYFDAIKRQLSDSDGKDEIMSDIEYRISELFSEKLKSDKQVISMKDLDEVITIMGEPQDYRLDENEQSENSQSSQNQNYGKTKKLYRDMDDHILGGVLSGLGHYFGIDKVWLRIIALCLFFFYGTGVLIYIILWIVMPEAKTTSEKLEMKGEAVNISSIEKKVREEFNNFSQKVNDIDYQKFGNKVNQGAEKVGNSISNFFLGFFGIIGKIIGVFIIIFAVGALVSLIIALITLGTTQYFQLPWLGISEAFNYSEVPVWVLGILFLLAIGIPFVAFLMLGFRILIPNSKPSGNIFKYSMFGIWIISVITLIIVGVRQATEVAFEERVSETQYIQIQPTDKLYINLSGNDRFSNSNRHKNFKLVLDINEKEVMYSNNIKLYFRKTKESQPYVVVSKIAEGNSLINAKKRAEEIKYNFTLNENQLIFDDYLLVDLKSKFRNQSVKVEVFIPENQVFYVEGNGSNYQYNIYVDGNTVRTNHFYVFEGSTYKCLDCITETEEKDEVKIKIINDTTLVVPEQGRLEIGNDGTIIKK